MREKIVGIIGGMGPEATVDLMARVIKATPALDDVDHIRMLVDNNPKVPSRIRALIEGGGESPAPCLQEMARRLAAWGADFLAMPCNTAHYYHREIQEAVAVPLLDMIDLAVREVTGQTPGLRSVGLLASSAVLRLKLYEDRFARAGAALLPPGDRRQHDVMQTIRRIKAGGCGSEAVAAVQAAADDLAARGAEALLVACTELSIIGHEIRAAVKLFDSAQILAEAIVKEARSAG
ncbi:MAG: amino acid racemase [Desulfobacterales bacterium]|jgi:aspartate racemase|nr:amino acid racemase [Desulfobacterales bacterium]